ncbi:DUF1376 domain-containing protein [Thiomonas delicata]|uniref:DUF1376 domain-containing protein n=1 Tax=Thiomonas delicata TaxID=364030 RepID=A0A238D2K3_THIDL|nr:DUF1376 domain-containing protein [Thiomonas delicata]SBP87496.1 conserved hypothetical protein [Thiomonas delicata]
MTQVSPSRDISPAPLTPPTCDLRAMPHMPLDVTRLLNSDFIAQTDCPAFKAGMTLMLTSWQQVPAASLPSDDRSLAWLAHVTPQRWRKIKDQALRGWMLCSDGRLYHPVIAEFALDAFDKVRERLDDSAPARRISSSAERMRRLRARQKAERDAASQASHVTPGVTLGDVTSDVTCDGCDASPVTPPPHTPPSKEEEKEKGSDARDASPVTPGVTQEVTPVTASQPQRHLPILQAMPASAGAHAPSPPPISQTQDTSPNPAPMDGKAKGKHPSLTPAEKQLAEQLWQHYSEAFQSRYDAPPLRDGKVNYQLASLTRSLGQQAPAVAVHYLQSNHDWYVRKGHDLGTLLADASKVRADWMAASKRAAQLDAVRARNHQPPQTSTPPKESPPAPETIRAQLAALQEKFTRRAASA